MIDREHELPLTRQALLVGLSRGAIYYEPRPLPQCYLLLMRRMDVTCRLSSCHSILRK